MNFVLSLRPARFFGLLALSAFFCLSASAAAISCGAGGWQTIVFAQANVTNDNGLGQQQTSGYNSLNQPLNNCLTSPSVSASNGGSLAGNANNSNANMFVNLAAGTLGGALGAAGVNPLNSAGLSSAGTASEYIDTLTFTIPGASPGTMTVIPFSFSLNGTANGAQDGSFFQVVFGTCGFTQSTSAGGPPTDIVGATGCTTSSVSGASHFGVLFNGSITVTGANPSVLVSAILDLTQGSPGTSDFSHTAAFHLNQPSGDTFTSASGVFLTAASSPVPEPAGTALVGFGLCGLAILRRCASVHSVASPRKRRNNHARATCISRSTVALDSDVSSAVSSAVHPRK